MENKNHSSGNGFMWGVIIGVSLTLLFTTKKGRKILKELSNVGLDTLEKVSEVEDLEKIIEDDEELQEEVELHKEEVSTPIKESNGHKAPKRFFKGIKKKAQ